MTRCSFSPQDSLRLEEKLQEKQSKEEERWERQRTLEKLKEKVCWRDVINDVSVHCGFIIYFIIIVILLNIVKQIKQPQLCLRQVHVSRDPSRLWKRTKVWEERMREIGPSGSGAAPLLHISHR